MITCNKCSNGYFLYPNTYLFQVFDDDKQLINNNTDSTKVYEDYLSYNLLSESNLMMNSSMRHCKKTEVGLFANPRSRTVWSLNPTTSARCARTITTRQMMGNACCIPRKRSSFVWSTNRISTAKSASRTSTKRLQRSAPLLSKSTSASCTTGTSSRSVCSAKATTFSKTTFAR